jgi:hypothetical protein
MTVKNPLEAMYVHNIVARAFIPNPKKLPRVRHIDGDGGNNAATNLEWCAVDATHVAPADGE